MAPDLNKETKKGYVRGVLRNFERGATAADNNNEIKTERVSMAADIDKAIKEGYGCYVVNPDVVKQSVKIQADIVFVHGLAGNRFKTWAEDSIFWPRDLLSTEDSMSDVRIMTFGYDADVAHPLRPVSQNNVLQHADNLLQALRGKRVRIEERERPLIFVAHSLGGLVVKQALETSKQDVRHNERVGMIFRCTYGVVFLGTPHRGGDETALLLATTFQKLAKLTLRQPNDTLLRELKANAPTLMNLLRSFARMIEDKEITVYSFLEEVPVSGIGLIVNAASGYLEIATERKGTLHRNHMEMIRFSSKDDSNYEAIFTAILELLEEAKEAVEAQELPKPLEKRQLCKQGAAEFDQTELPSVDDASYDSHFNESNDLKACLPDTRVDVLKKIECWARNADTSSESLFWLNGMAGTGKSAIARTVAENLARQKTLGASFFFKRGEGDRAKASKLLTTITRQLLKRIPEMALGVRNAINNDPDIRTKQMVLQFQELIEKPLSRIKNFLSPPLVLVIDALDECERESDMKLILDILPNMGAMNPVRLKVFLTSRPECLIRLGFEKMPETAHKDFILQSVPIDTIEHDLSVVLRARLADIDYLPPNWPDEETKVTLVKMASPLFIIIVTICRYLGRRKWDFEERLKELLKQGSSGRLTLEDTYLPILNRLLEEENNQGKFVLVDEDDQAKFVKDFKEIVGSIVIFDEPLSAEAISELLDIPQGKIEGLLGDLHSVIEVPRDPQNPVRPLHLSFRDFLLDKKKCDKFHIQEASAHGMLATRCLQCMQKSVTGLRENICGFSRVGQLRNEISKERVNAAMSESLRYACQNWLHHIENSTPSHQKSMGNRSSKINDFEHEIFAFLKDHFLHWLEAMGLMGKAREAVLMINKLVSLVQDEKSDLSEFIHDAKRFILASREMIEIAPLQLYTSALIFSPPMSIIRKRFEMKTPGFRVRRVPEIPTIWGPMLQDLHGHSSTVYLIAFSPTGDLMASVSEPLRAVPSSVILWDVETGVALQDFEPFNPIEGLEFSPDGTLLALSDQKGILNIRNVETSECGVLGPYQSYATASYTARKCGVSFSPDQRLLASVWGGFQAQKIHLWCLDTLTLLRSLNAYDGDIKGIAFSPDGATLVSDSIKNESGRLHGAATRNLRVWDVNQSTTVRTYNKTYSSSTSTLHVHDIQFSTDGILIASTDQYGAFSVHLWDAKFEKSLVPQFPSHYNKRLRGVAILNISSTRKVLAVAFQNGALQHWDIETGAITLSLEPPGRHRDIDFVNAGFAGFAFSHKKKLLASAPLNSTVVRLWDAMLPGDVGHEDLEILSNVAVSQDGTVATGSIAGTVKLWAGATGKELRTLKRNPECKGGIMTLRFSPSGKHVHMVGKVREPRNWENWERCCGTVLWETNTGEALLTSTADGTVVFSPNYDLACIFGMSFGISIRLFDIQTPRILHDLELPSSSGNVLGTVFATNGSSLISISEDGRMRRWDTGTGALTGVIYRSDSLRYRSTCPVMAVSANGRRCATSMDYTIQMWDFEPGSGASDHQIANVPPASVSFIGSVLRPDALQFSPDAQIIAAVPYQGKMVHLWDVETGSLLRSIELASRVKEMEFSSDGQRLITNRGIISLPTSEAAKYSQEPDTSKIFMGESWIVRGFERILWLPVDYRTENVAFCNRTLALVVQSSLVIVQFD